MRKEILLKNSLLLYYLNLNIHKKMKYIIFILRDDFIPYKLYFYRNKKSWIPEKFQIFLNSSKHQNFYKLIIHYVYCLQLPDTCDIVSLLSFVHIRHPFNEFLTRLIIAHCSQLRLSLTCPCYQMSKRLHTMGNIYIYMHIIDYRMMLLPFRNENIIILRNLYSIAASCS